MSCETALREQLRDQGLRFTSQREVILCALHQLEAPVTVEEIFALVKTENPHIDISTVYRTMELFQRMHIVSGYDLGDGKKRFEHVGIEQPHHHLICRECGCVISISNDILLPLIQNISDMHSFSIDPDGVTITGLCIACQPKGKPDSYNSGIAPSVLPNMQ